MAVYKPGGRKNREGAYRVSYTDGTTGRRRVFYTGTGDYGAARMIEEKLKREAALRRAGIVCPADERRAEAERKPLALHLDEYRDYLAAKGDTRLHADKTKARAKRVFAACGADLLSALSVARVQGVLADFRKGGTGLETLNGYRRAVRGFSRWLHREGRISEDALLGLSGFNAKLDRRRKRRVLTDEELGKLLAEAERGPAVQGMTGRDRAVLYQLALRSGLRLSEIRSLRSESFDLDVKPPVVRVQAAYTKNRKEVAQALPASLVAILRPWLAEKLQERFKVGPARWRGLFPVSRGAEMIRHDLAAAEIPYKNASGFFDFHAQRGTYGTRLSRVGTNPAVLKDLIRHADIKTTMDHYVRMSLMDHQAALESVPEIPAPAARREALRATGTDGGFSAPDAIESATSAVPDSGEASSGPTGYIQFAQGTHNPLVPGSNPGGPTSAIVRIEG